MFVVDDILVADDLVDAPFACALHSCLGACCVEGDQGAPLEAEECARLEAILPRVRKYLRPEALEVIDRRGVWEEVAPGKFATTCVDNRECVFVCYEGPVAVCAIQKAYEAGRIDWPKPISCHLFPVRVHTAGGQEMLNYERIDLCRPACKKGRKKDIQLIDFLKEPLIRKYGRTWYDRLCKAVAERRKALGLDV